MTEFCWMSAAEMAAAIRSRELKPSELVAATLARVEALNPALNAVCALRAEAAMAEARALEAQIGRGGELGPLAGVPIGVKDLEDVAGMLTTYGSVPFKDNRAAQDSVQVARLRAAGAIVVGKTNTPEFGFTPFTKNLLYGVTRNPWNPQLTPGGSSGGSGAAVAAGILPLATGSDWGGSIRIPACFCGCFGLKPSQGRIPMEPRLGMTSWVDLSAVGPLSRTVRDAAIFMDVVAGYHPIDPASLPHPGLSYEAALERPLSRLRVAFHPDFGHRVDREVAEQAAQAAQTFAEMGHELTVIEEPLPEIGLAWDVIGSGETIAKLGPFLADHREEYGRAFLAHAEAARQITWADYGDAWRARTELNQWARKIFERFDLLLTPTLAVQPFAAGGPPPSEIDGKPIANSLEAIVFTYPFNVTGHPAASVRAGITARGLPCGLQIIAERHRDDLVLQAAHAYEQARPWGDRWPRL